LTSADRRSDVNLGEKSVLPLADHLTPHRLWPGAAAAALRQRGAVAQADRNVTLVAAIGTNRRR
jgi:hypothetical protein